ncbi:MAG: protelomerase family protein [Thainema sp.]
MPTTQPLAENWLSAAESCGSTKWLRQFIRYYVAQLQAERITPEALASELEEEFASRKLNTPAQQKNYRSNVVQAIKVFDPDHPAIDLVGLSTAQYRMLNDQQRERMADRQTRFITSEAAESIVKRASQLITSTECAEIGAGLAVLIGRRISEILLSTFSLKSPWSLMFSKMAKKPDTLDITIEIPTLAPARVVLAAIERLQTGLKVNQLRLQGMSSRQAKLRVNQLYSGAIAAKCNECFRDLVPTRSDRDNLYTHLFRAVYATIAAHWYCPPSVPEHQFKAEIQGHFTVTLDGKKLPTYAARSNYDDYAIGNGDGNRDGRLGIKLGQVPDLEVIEVFRHPQNSPTEQSDKPPTAAAITEVAAESATKVVTKVVTESATDGAEDSSYADTADTADTAAVENSDRDRTTALQTKHSPQDEPHMTESDARKSTTKRANVYADDLEQMTDLMAHRGITGSTADVFHALVKEFEAQTEQGARQGAKTLGEVAQAINWFTSEIETLRQQYRALEEEHRRLVAQQTESEPKADTEPDKVAEKERNAQLEDQNAQLEARNAKLESDLRETRSQLNAIQELLGGVRKGKQPQVTTPESAPTSAKAPAAQSAASQSKSVADKAAQQDDAHPEKIRDRADSTEKIADVIDAIIKWNTAQERSEQRLRISFPSVRSLAVLVGASYLPAIREVMKDKEAEIDQIHERYTIGSRHNRSVLDKDKVLQAIARDYLGIPNWQEATYVN